MVIAAASPVQWVNFGSGCVGANRLAARFSVWVGSRIKTSYRLVIKVPPFAHPLLSSALLIGPLLGGRGGVVMLCLYICKLVLHHFFPSLVTNQNNIHVHVMLLFFFSIAGKRAQLHRIVKKKKTEFY